MELRGNKLIVCFSWYSLISLLRGTSQWRTDFTCFWERLYFQSA